MGKWAKIKNYFMNISLLSYIYKGKVFHWMILRKKSEISQEFLLRAKPNFLIKIV